MPSSPGKPEKLLGGGFAGKGGARRWPSDGLGTPRRCAFFGHSVSSPCTSRLLPDCPASGAGVGLGECADGFAGSQSDGKTCFGFSSATCSISVAFLER